MFMREWGLEGGGEWEKKYGGKLGGEEGYVYGGEWYVDGNGGNMGVRSLEGYDYMIGEWGGSE